MKTHKKDGTPTAAFQRHMDEVSAESEREYLEQQDAPPTLDQLLALLMSAREACAEAYNHIDTYGIVSGPQSEIDSQRAVFNLLRPHTKVAGHGVVARTELTVLP